MRKKRIKSWVITIVIALGLFYVEPFVLNLFSQNERTPLTLYAPEYMHDAFVSALANAGMKNEYKIVMSKDKNADICIDYGKENDEEYFKFAFSPFVVAYAQSDYIKQLEKSEVVIPSQYDGDYREIDFLKVINEVIKDGSWKNLGVSDLNKIKIFYPSRESIYWNDFFDFMLVTINNGTYPQTNEELVNATKIIEQFEKSNYTEGILNFKEQIQRTGGFPENVFYILPEQEAYINKDYKKEVIFPTITVYFNYYIKRNEVANMLISHFNDKGGLLKGSFYTGLEINYYRSNDHSSFSTAIDYVIGERNVYNVADIPKGNDTTGSTTTLK